nr:unnamed protein product [uncultured Mediterranean phage uvMED]|tara:strand:- start:495 stop:812 length:318 start_codon:yes stop_codon:yes gene_type:complete
MDEQDYKNLIAIYQQKAQDFFNQTVAAETREMKYKQQAEVYANRVTELQKQLSAASEAVNSSNESSRSLKERLSEVTRKLEEEKNKPVPTRTRKVKAKDLVAEEF